MRHHSITTLQLEAANMMPPSEDAAMAAVQSN
jgi:hypothetical protein